MFEKIKNYLKKLINFRGIYQNASPNHRNMEGTKKVLTALFATLTPEDLTGKEALELAELCVVADYVPGLERLFNQIAQQGLYCIAVHHASWDVIRYLENQANLLGRPALAKVIQSDADQENELINAVIKANIKNIKRLIETHPYEATTNYGPSALSVAISLDEIGIVTILKVLPDKYALETCLKLSRNKLISHFVNQYVERNACNILCQHLEELAKQQEFSRSSMISCGSEILSNKKITPADKCALLGLVLENLLYTDEHDVKIFHEKVNEIIDFFYKKPEFKEKLNKIIIKNILKAISTSESKYINFIRNIRGVSGVVANEIIPDKQIRFQYLVKAIQNGREDLSGYLLNKDLLELKDSEGNNLAHLALQNKVVTPLYFIINKHRLDMFEEKNRHNLSPKELPSDNFPGLQEEWIQYHNIRIFIETSFPFDFKMANNFEGKRYRDGFKRRLEVLEEHIKKQDERAYVGDPKEIDIYDFLHDELHRHLLVIYKNELPFKAVPVNLLNYLVRMHTVNLTEGYFCLDDDKVASVLRHYIYLEHYKEALELIRKMTTSSLKDQTYYVSKQNASMLELVALIMTWHLTMETQPAQVMLPDWTEDEENKGRNQNYANLLATSISTLCANNETYVSLSKKSKVKVKKFAENAPEFDIKELVGVENAILKNELLAASRIILNWLERYFVVPSDISLEEQHDVLKTKRDVLAVFTSRFIKLNDIYGDGLNAAVALLKSKINAIELSLKEIEESKKALANIKPEKKPIPVVKSSKPKPIDAATEKKVALPVQEELQSDQALEVIQPTQVDTGEEGAFTVHQPQWKMREEKRKKREEEEQKKEEEKFKQKAEDDERRKQKQEKLKQEEKMRKQEEDKRKQEQKGQQEVDKNSHHETKSVRRIIIRRQEKAEPESTVQFQPAAPTEIPSQLKDDMQPMPQYPTATVFSKRLYGRVRFFDTRKANADGEVALNSTVEFRRNFLVQQIRSMAEAKHNYFVALGTHEATKRVAINYEDKPLHVIEHIYQNLYQWCEMIIKSNDSFKNQWEQKKAEIKAELHNITDSEIQLREMTTDQVTAPYLGAVRSVSEVLVLIETKRQQQYKSLAMLAQAKANQDAIISPLIQFMAKLQQDYAVFASQLQELVSQPKGAVPEPF